jgi:hypothetical protein
MQRQLRDTSNPFSLPNRMFLKLFGLNKRCCLDLVENLRPHMIHAQRTTAIPVHLRVLTALHFFGYGSYQLGVGHGYSFALSQPSVSRCITEVSNCIVTHLMHQWIKFPNSPQARQNKKQGFLHVEERFPDLFGVTDCTQIRIVAPPAEHPVHPGAAYYCRKNYYSINTQIICDADREIININARFPGSVHDATIWMMSQIKPALQEVYVRNNELNYFNHLQLK